MTATLPPRPVDTAGPAPAPRPPAGRGALRALLGPVLTGLITLVVVLLAWQGLILALNISPFLAKGPLDVWTWLVSVPEAAENRAVIGDNLRITLGDAFLGFTAGLVAATLLATVFTLSRGVENALMPVALLLRTVPLVALAPVISLITGRGLTTVVVMGSIVVLFPALVNIAFGLRSTSPQIGDVITVYGGNAFTALRLVAFPSSLPSFFAAVKISIPGAITGALLAEWLSTGTGLGNGIVTAVAQSKNSEVWASVVAITVVSLLLYGVAQLVENLVLGRMAPRP